MGCELQGLRHVSSYFTEALIGQPIKTKFENFQSWSIEASKDAFPFVSIIHLGFGQNRFLDYYVIFTLRNYLHCITLINCI